MEKGKLIQKWLEGTLTKAEEEKIQQLEEFADYQRISNAAAHFEAPAFDVKSSYKHIQKEINSSHKTPWYKVAMSVAAVFAIAFASYFAFFYNNLTEIQAVAGTTQQVYLPDSSLVKLNAGSTLSYSKNDWANNRVVKLEGEAYFEVHKGKKFQVETSKGTITVLGTHFNVKQRKNFFEVTCFEGLVKVETATDTLRLPAGTEFRLLDGIAQKNTLKKTGPSWTQGISTFESVPFIQAINELERQYDVQIITKSLTFDATELYTGSFVNHDLDDALKSVTLPFNLTYSVHEHTVTLKESDQ